ncbi:MAG: NAD(P)H-hydrate dehydratase [Chloroflexi bacterium]|nr:NAD(P)H-hydrate dehydratase [Chloroflexota bacterium]
MRIVSVSQMIELEKEANERGFTNEKMMENAGKGLADFVHQNYSKNPEQSVLGLIGSGNNGGDTLIALTQLLKYGWGAKAYLVKERTSTDPLISNFIIAGGEFVKISDDRSFSQLKKWLRESHVIFDGILGTGVRLPLQGDIPNVLNQIRSAHPSATIVAVDCPSGVDCDSGETAEECLKADRTVCFAAVKTGLLKNPAYKSAGEISVVDIGLPKSMSGWKEVNGDILIQSKITELLPIREMDYHKGSFGTCLIVAGSVNYCGAVLLASKGAYRAGAGLIQAAIPGAIYDAVAGDLPEATWLVLPHIDGVFNRDAALVLKKNLDRISSILIGPGIGLDEETHHFIEGFIHGGVDALGRSQSMGFSGSREIHQLAPKTSLPPLVIDADALKLLNRIENWWKKLPNDSILTPHPGEMSVLTGLSIDEIQNARVEKACEFAKKWGQVVVLKGAMTVVANPNGKFSIIPIATSALATAGTGDVLAGMIAGFRAQGLNAFPAAKVGAWVHAKAGLMAAEKIGNEASVMAGDVANAISDVINKITGIKY